MLDTKDRHDKSTVVWHKVDPSTPYLTISSYQVRTKSKGDKIVLLLSSYPEIPTLGLTTDDSHFKSMAYKVYDFTKIGTDVQGNILNYACHKKNKHYCIEPTWLNISWPISI